jgi:RimJ/RimL family protein N-acetyltransferase
VNGEALLRPASFDDARLLWQWRNEPEVRQNSFDTGEIDWNTHTAWLERKLTSPDCRIWVLENGSDPIGQIRYDRVDRIAELSFSITSRFRGRGFGTLILERSWSEACRELDVAGVRAMVKDDNLPSQRACERAGFTRGGPIWHRESRCWSYERRCDNRDRK